MTAIDRDALAAKIETALIGIDRRGAGVLPHCASIKRQLEWCRAYLQGVETPRPGPFTMGLIATRNFDMWGDDPEFSGLINEIETRMNEMLGT